MCDIWWGDVLNAQTAGGWPIFIYNTAMYIPINNLAEQHTTKRTVWRGVYTREFVPHLEN